MFKLEIKSMTVKPEDKQSHNYYLTENQRGDFWLHNEEGEGMEFGQHELFLILDKYFKENF